MHAWSFDGQAFEHEDVPVEIGPFTYRRDSYPWWGDYFGLTVGPEWVYLLYPTGDAATQRVHTQLIRRDNQ